MDLGLGRCGRVAIGNDGGSETELNKSEIGNVADSDWFSLGWPCFFFLTVGHVPMLLSLAPAIICVCASKKMLDTITEMQVVYQNNVIYSFLFLFYI